MLPISYRLIRIEVATWLRGFAATYAAIITTTSPKCLSKKEGQPRSTGNKNPSRAYVGDYQQCHYGGLSLNMRLDYLAGWTNMDNHNFISSKSFALKKKLRILGSKTASVFVDSCNFLIPFILL